MIYQLLLNDDQRSALIPAIEAGLQALGSDTATRHDAKVLNHLAKALDDAHDINDGEVYTTEGKLGDLVIVGADEVIY